MLRNPSYSVRALEAAPTPSGCDAADFQPNVDCAMSANFSGCVVNRAHVLQKCCTGVGSTAAFVNGTCGCPYNATAGFTSYKKFFGCVEAV
ncbi:hypothetical protein B0H17DRAFT_1210036 [Mycena rosella]|uniref:Uncharacterized protein n=1 Tax=Mycena rosella TaxID=1033263 RepID=A0AAD7G7V1_MYCRO|nr:hypothetical protein B0H17DRAFT_1210036 [Mycena rosella]